jgi:Zn-dependent protease with chaperone function
VTGEGLLLFTAASAGAAVLTAVLSPLVLTVGRWQLLHPRAALTAWFVAFFLGLSLAAAAVAGSVMAAVTVSEVASHGQAVLVTAGGWLGLGAFGAVIAFVATSAADSTGAEQSSQVAAALAKSREERGGFTLVRFRCDQPIACAVPGKHPEILLSTAMEETLTVSQLQAVLAHECAHLRQWHGWAVRIAQINALCLPRVLPGRALQRATVLLIELAADDAAARQAGAAHLANALTVLANTTGDESMHLRAVRLTARRWPSAGRRRLPQAIRILPT